MSSEDDRGWNIVGDEARPSWLARLMGASKSGEPSIYALFIWAVLFTAVAGRLLGLW